MTETCKILGLFSPPGSLRFVVVRFFGGGANTSIPQVFATSLYIPSHSDSFSSLPPGTCWHLRVLILMLWLLILSFRQWLLFCHWEIQKLCTKKKKSWKCIKAIDGTGRANHRSHRLHQPDVLLHFKGGAIQVKLWVTAYGFTAVCSYDVATSRFPTEA